MFSPSQYYTFPDRRQELTVPEYDYTKKSIKVNNNYFKLNPIYDSSGQEVNITDEDTSKMTILVPEKYKPFEEDLKLRYEEYRTWHYHISEDYYRELNGEDVGYSKDEDAKSKYGLIPIQILYIKDNQDYFFYRNLAKYRDLDNYIKDPVVMVMNNSNCGWDEYGAAIGSAEYFVKVNNIDNPIEDVKEDLIATDTEANISLYSLYRNVDVVIHDMYQQLFVQIFIIIISLAVLAAILMISATNYTEIKKHLNAVEKIHGYSFFKRHWKHLLTTPVFWTAMFGVGSVFATATNLISIGQLSLAALTFMLIELLISIPIIKIKEMKKTKDVLKGE